VCVCVCLCVHERGCSEVYRGGLEQEGRDADVEVLVEVENLSRLGATRG